MPTDDACSVIVSVFAVDGVLDIMNVSAPAVVHDRYLLISRYMYRATYQLRH